MKIITKLVILCVVCMNSVYAAVTQTGENITVPHHKSVHVMLSGNAQRVSLGDPDVLDIVILRANEIFLIGKKLGSTNLMVWDRNNQLIESINVEVTHDLNALKSKVFEFLPEENIEVYSAQDRLVLSGQVSSQEVMNKVIKIAETYTSGQAADKSKGSSDSKVAKTGIVNLMTIGGAQQVTLEVTVAEVQRSLVRKFDANFHFFQTSGSQISWGASSVGAGIAGATPIFDVPTSSDYGILGSFIDGNSLFSVALDMAKQDGVAKVLAEPNLTALSGSKAEFLAGGEFPIPVPSEDGIGIDYKEFGVGLKFIPTVLSDKKINLNLMVSVSEVATTNTLTVTPGSSNASYFIPPITRRSASSTLELADGQTIGIAGLLSENSRDNANKMPGIGDVPVLGQLFNSKEYTSGETELVILVTPRLAKPIDRSKVTLPTDAYVEPNDLEYYLLGRGAYIQDREMEQQEQEPQNDKQIAEAGGSEGEFGHSL